MAGLLNQVVPSKAYAPTGLLDRQMADFFKRVPDPLEVMRRLGLNVPSSQQMGKLFTAVPEFVGPQADVAGMVRDAGQVMPNIRSGDYGQAALNTLAAAAAIPFMALPGTVSQVKGATKKVVDELPKPNVNLLTEVKKTPDFKGHAKDVYWTKDPITLKDIFSPDEDYAASVLAEARHGSADIVDPVSSRILKSTKKQIYETTQKALENFPDKVKVYRMSPENAPFSAGGVGSFTLDPKFSGRSLPWATERGSTGPIRERLKKNYKLTEYLVDKKDILAAPNALWKGLGSFDEYEVILRTDALK